MRVYEKREDLYRVFPEARNGNISRSLTWAKKHGINEDLKLFRFSPYFEEF
jgi:hypothetical protein